MARASAGARGQRSTGGDKVSRWGETSHTYQLHPVSARGLAGAGRDGHLQPV